MEKWYFIFAAIAMTVIFGGLTVSESVGNMAKRDIIVACYHSGTQNCDQVWNKTKR